MEISAIGFGGEEEDDGSNVWTEHLTEELPALMERMICVMAGRLLQSSLSLLFKVAVLSSLLSVVRSKCSRSL